MTGPLLSNERLSPARRIQAIPGNLAAQRIAVNSQNLSGAALIPLGVLQHAFDEFLLELRESLFEKDAALHHHSDQRFQLLFHVEASANCSGSVECVAGNALIGFSIFLLRADDHFGRKRRSRWLLVPTDLFQVIANVLLIE